MKRVLVSSDYATFLAEVKVRINTARLSASRAVNRSLIALYWDIGKAILNKQELEKWGESVVERLAADLRSEFPNMRGFSAANLWAMRRFYMDYGHDPILQQLAEELAGKNPSWVARMNDERPAVAMNTPVGAAFLQRLAEEIPWGHHLLLLDKVKDRAARFYYLRATAQLGWSRAVLLNQIKAGAYERSLNEGKAHNFHLALPGDFAEQAEEALKSRYNLEFLGVGRAMKERELENRLVERLQQFILELGYGFCFIGRQHRLALGRKEYFVDLLFYHRFLRALVAFDLKIGPFEPEHAGKMDFYLNLLNDRERAPGDRPSIGIILCAEKDDVEVEFALKTKTNPIGVAEYQLQAKLPPELKGKLPTERQLADAVRKALPEKRSKSRRRARNKHSAVG